MAYALLLSPQGLRLFEQAKTVTTSFNSTDTDVVKAQKRQDLLKEVISLTNRIALAVIFSQVFSYLSAINIVFGLGYFAVQAYFLTPRVMAIRAAPLFIEGFNFTAGLISAASVAHALARVFIGVPWMAICWYGMSHDTDYAIGKRVPVIEKAVDDLSNKEAGWINRSIEWIRTTFFT